MSKHLLFFILLGLLFPAVCKCQKLFVKDTSNGKILKIRQGRVIGVTTKTDTIDGYSYRDTVNPNLSHYSPMGLWTLKLWKGDTNHLYLVDESPTPRYSFNISEILSIQYQKEQDAGARQTIFWLGAVGGTLGGISTIVESIGKKESITPGLIITSVGISTIAYLRATRNRYKTKSYKIFRIK